MKQYISYFVKEENVYNNQMSIYQAKIKKEARNVNAFCNRIDERHQSLKSACVLARPEVIDNFLSVAKRKPKLAGVI